MTTVAFTGHRKLPSEMLVYQNLTNTLQTAVEKYDDLQGIAGGALGVDTIAAEVMADLAIPYKLYLPCHNQDRFWSEQQKERYQLTLLMAQEVRYIYEGDYPGAWVMFRRNEAMVDDCDFLIAVYDGSKTGGTAQCVGYAEMRNKTIVTLRPNIEYVKGS